MTTTGTGIFYDGITSNRREVAVEIAGDAIEVRGPGGCLKARWYFADISPLARHFLGEGLHLSEDAAAALQAHDWPGNVRELRNSIERAKLLARDRVVVAADLNLPAATRAVPREAEHFSKEVLEASLREAGGNISRAAQSLGLSRQALYRRLERFNLRPLSGS